MRVCADRLNTVAGALHNRSPRSAASEASSLASAVFVVMGFSQYTCFPADRAARFTV
ncbi:hypothetical protein [Streptomyces eurythermus]|uniref:hypothetical protein n=1 Tax=Streptomyces eurythermus TaxID=42237 RepID=UPI0036D280B3